MDVRAVGTSENPGDGDASIIKWAKSVPPHMAPPGTTGLDVTRIPFGKADEVA